METFSTLLALCAGNSLVTGDFPAQRPVTQSFDVSFALRLNKWSSKQSWSWWFETSSCPLWRHRNEICYSTWMRLKITRLILLPHTPADNELKSCSTTGRCNVNTAGRIYAYFTNSKSICLTTKYCAWQPPPPTNLYAHVCTYDWERFRRSTHEMHWIINIFVTAGFGTKPSLFKSFARNILS